MKTTIVYVLVSSSNDVYLEQSFVSIFTMRHYNPNANIILLVDDNTARTLTGSRANILNYITAIKSIEIRGEYTNIQKSRILKTTMRQYIVGDFLFVDSDTIVCDKLTEIDDLDCQIGAVYDVHQRNQGKEFLSKKLSPYAGFDASLIEEYFNSGILFVKDSPLTRHFFNKWHENWKIFSKNGSDYDQPALAVTDYQSGRIIKQISGIYNCQIRFCLNYLVDAKIIHYFSSRDTDISPLFEKKFYTDIKKNEMTIPIEYLPMILNPKKNFSRLTVIKSGDEATLAESLYLTYSTELYQQSRKAYNLVWMLLRFLRKITAKRKIKHV